MVCDSDVIFLLIFGWKCRPLPVSVSTTVRFTLCNLEVGRRPASQVPGLSHFERFSRLCV
jgi:hypothetical protein